MKRGIQGGDVYFHSKAHAQSAQLGKIAEQTAKLLGDMREFTDFYQGIFKNVLLLRDKTIPDLIRDDLHDLKINAAGRKIGREHPASDLRDYLDIFRPEGLDEKY